MHHPLLVSTASLLPQFVFFSAPSERVCSSLYSFQSFVSPWCCRSSTMRFNSHTLLTTLALLPALVLGQLSGRVRPLTSHATKAQQRLATSSTTVRSQTRAQILVLHSHLPSLHAKSGGTVVIPSGNYALATWVRLSGGSAWAFQLDGIIYRTGAAGGDMIFIEHSDDSSAAHLRVI